MAETKRRKKVIDLVEGDRTNWWVVTEQAKQTDAGVLVPVTYHEGGSGVRAYDHPDIEIEVLEDE